MGVRQDAGPVHVGYYDAHGERERRRSARTESYPAEFLPRDSIFEQLEKEVLPPEEVPRTLYGIQNALWLLVALAFVRPPLIRLIRREWPVIDVDFLRWIFSGFGTTFAMYLVMCTATSISFALHWLTLRGFLAVATRETLFRLAQCAHLVLTCRWIVNSTLSPCPSFALVMQAMVTFLKMHSYYAEVRQALQSMPDGDDISKLVNVEGFLYFWVAPTLVYRIEGYPRSEGIRSRFLVRKFGSLLGLLLVIFLLITDQFLPAFARARNTPTLETALVLVVPCAILLVSLFFIIFEVILNILGEVTLFADRHFYDDWWNATSMDEFSRKWNRPVHDWLNIYVNRSARRAGYSHAVSVGATFLFSAIFHEMILAVTFRRPRVYLLSLMMLQMPLIRLLSGRFKDRTGQRFANVFFWFGLFVGPALLSLVYAREWYITTHEPE